MSVHARVLGKSAMTKEEHKSFTARQRGKLGAKMKQRYIAGRGAGLALGTQSLNPMGRETTS